MTSSNKNKSKAPPPKTPQNFPIVGIGASAGGLDSFKKLLAAIPGDSGMAYVLVQHLDPKHESILPEILQRVTKIPVYEITDDIHLAPNHIYVIPSNKILTSTDGVLQLSPRKDKVNLAIDVFFTTLAEVHKECAVGIVLSGTGTDGTFGLKAIKEHGGICMAQDSASAAFDSMPQSAINAGVIDFVLAPQDMPAELLNINNAYKANHLFSDEEELLKDVDYDFKQILTILRQRTGVDFSYYKKPTFHRRIARRIAIVKKDNVANYLKFLRTDKAEQDALFQDVLIPVTSFFRDPKTFQTLTETVFPSILKNKSVDDVIRIWIAGCSTGQEAYSIAICLYEYLTMARSQGETDFLNPALAAKGAIQIFASDISDKVIKKARKAIYTKAEVEPFSETQLRNYFVKNFDGYEVSKVIRDMCVFAPHNFLKDPPFAKIDLITCRNVLIYMDTFLHKKAFTTFHYALKENGILVLGKSETIGGSSDLFSQLHKHEKIYVRKSVPGRFMHETNLPLRGEFLNVQAGSQDRKTTPPVASGHDYKKSAEAIMIAKSPASVIVNEQMDIVDIHGDITPFLQAPQGQPTHNLIKMAREGLAFELRNAIHKAAKEQTPVEKENILVHVNENQLSVTFEIIPLLDTSEIHYLIRFEKKVLTAAQDEKKSTAGKAVDMSRKLSAQNEQLEKNLAQAREDMRFITEDMEAANEELQSANEELQSSNEEMQSLNEELETSKEELQSTNEELIIVNQELLDKQEQLNAFLSEQVEARKIIDESEKEQKKLARHLKLATDSAKVGIWSLDVLSSRLEWSSTHKKMWGYDENRSDLTYEDWHNVIVTDDKKMTIQKVNYAKDNHTIYEAQYRINRANDGTIVWIKSSGQYYYDEFGVAHTLTGVSIDITEQKEYEEKVKAAVAELASKNNLIEQSEQSFRELSASLEVKVQERTAALQNLNEELKQTNKHLDQFAYVASHDLQEPLRKIMTFSTRLQENHKNELNTEVILYLDKIQSASLRMSRLIHDLLNYSRLLQHEKIFVKTDLNKVLKNILTDFDFLILEKKAKITFDKLPIIDAIPLHMNQLFYNLISNALKFSKKDVTPIITIVSKIVSKAEILQNVALKNSVNINDTEEQSYVQIIFKDNGIGFNQQYANQIFTIFQRLHSQEEFIGTGIGLALAKEIIDNHQGELYAESQENLGAEFHIILPIKQLR